MWNPIRAYNNYKTVLKNNKTLLNAYNDISDETNRDRRTPRIEMHDEESLLSDRNRSQLIANVRENMRQFSVLAGWEDQFRRNVIGKGQSLHIKSSDIDTAKAASIWFNKYVRSLDAFDPKKRFNELSQLWLTSYRRDGDILEYFDHNGFINKGKVISFESDQLTSILESDFARNQTWIKNFINPFDDGTLENIMWTAEAGTIVQSKGVIFSAKRVIIGYIVATKGKRSVKNVRFEVSRNQEPLATNGALPLPASDCFLLFRTKRVNGYRGVSRYLTAINSMIDIKEILSAYKEKVKMQSFLALVYHTKGGKKLKNRTVAQDNTQADITTSASAPIRTLKNFIKLTRGAMEEINIDEKIENVSMAQDQQAIIEIIGFILQLEAWGQGMGRLYSQGTAQSSYTAGRAEANLTQVTFDDEQCLMANNYDWLANQVFKFGMNEGLITLPEDSEFRWTNFPRLPQIDPVKDTKAVEAKLKNGLTTLLKELGPEWEEMIEQLGIEKETSESVNLNLNSFVETTSDLNTGATNE